MDDVQIPAPTAALAAFFRGTPTAPPIAPLPAGSPDDLLVVAFSGGPDSSALLAALAHLARPDAPLAGVRLLAAHLDHGLDPQGTDRARRAQEIAGALEIELVVDRRPVTDHHRSGESLEAAARRVRYRFLEEVRATRGGRWIATAHHLDDQAETVLLRLLGGTGVEGLAAIRPRRGRVVRPALGLRRSDLLALLPHHLPPDAPPPADDPANRDPAFARTLVRHRLLPALVAAGETTPEDLARLAEVARRARRAVSRRLSTLLTTPERPASLDVEALLALPAPLWPQALALLARRSGRLPVSATARAELERQLAPARPAGDHGTAPQTTPEVGVDAGDGWRLVVEAPPTTAPGVSSGARLRLCPPTPAGPRETSIGRFSYTLEIPGTVAVPEIGRTVELVPAQFAPWMLRGERRRAALRLPPGTRTVEVRNRRPGDRLRPLGGPGERKLKDLLIDRKVPRSQRDRLPLLVVDGSIAWVPGVTIDRRFRLRESDDDGTTIDHLATPWVAELTETVSETTIKKLFTAAEIDRRIQDMGAGLRRDLSGLDPLFLSLVGGSVIFLADLLRAFGEPVRYELIHVATHEHEPSLKSISYPIPVDVEGESLVVLKDVVHSGLVESYLAQHLHDMGAKEVRFVALIDIPQARTNQLALHDRAFATDRQGALVGYGLKQHGRFGNLPYIGAVPSEEGTPRESQGGPTG